MTSSALPLPPNKLSRRYNCSACNLSTLRSRVHLYHQIVQHQENFIVYLCTVCEYASRWRCKILRHHSMAHKEMSVLGENDVTSVKPEEIRRQFRENACDLEKMLPSGLHLYETDSYLEDNDSDLKYTDREEQDLTPVEEGHNQTFAEFLEFSEMEQVKDTMEGTDDIAYICPQCGHVASNLVALNDHILAHGDDLQNAEEFTGQECTGLSDNESGEDSLLSIDLLVGGKHQNGSNRKYRCSQCSATFNWHGDLSVHLQSSHGIERGTKKTDSSSLYKCQFCNYQAKYQSELSRHNRLHLGVKPFRCHFCTYNSAWKGDLKRHLEAHHRKQIADEKLLNDIMASYKNNAGTRLVKDDLSNEIESLATDEASRYSNNSESQSKPGSSFITSEEALTSSIKSQCSVCEYFSTNLDEFQRHLFTHEGVRPYSCSGCEATFYLSWKADRHVKDEHSSEPHVYIYNLQGEKAQIITNRNLCPYMCSFCAKRTNSHRELLEHITDSHTDQKATIIFLDDEIASESCSKASIVESSPRQRQVDSVKLSNKGTLHKPTMSSKNYCGKGVQGNRPFRCSICGHRSNWKWDINKHIKVAHPDNKEAFTETLEPEEADATIEAYMREVKGKVKEENNETADGYNRPYRCSSCGHRSNWKWDVRKHIRLAHSDSADVYVETLSNEEAKRTLDEYMNTRKSGIAVDLNSSPKDISYGNSPRVDQMRLKRFKCSACGYRSNYRSDIVRHNKRKHEKKAEVIILSVDEANSSLEEYSRSFPQKTSHFFKMHTQSMSYEDSGSNQSMADSHGDSSEQAEAADKWKCSFCSFTSNKTESVLGHIKTEHPDKTFHEDELSKHLLDKAVSSNREDFIYSSNTDLSDENYNFINTAGLVLQNQSCLSCVLCQSSFTECTDLIEHYRCKHAKCDEDVALLSHPRMSLESNVQTQCPMCPYNTVYPSLLVIHNMLHSDNTPCQFRCRFCTYKATTATFLANHETLHRKNSFTNSPGSKLDEPLSKKQKMNTNNPQPTDNTTTDQKIIQTPIGCDLAYSQCLSCPWIGLSKKDLIVHKQGHRLACSNKYVSLKCPSCSYVSRTAEQASKHSVVHKNNYHSQRIAALRITYSQTHDIETLIDGVKKISSVVQKYAKQDLKKINGTQQLGLSVLLKKQLKNSQLSKEELKMCSLLFATD